MDKVVDLDATVHDLCAKYPELPGLLHIIGFSDITKPGMLHTVGRFMTLRKGAVMKGISLETIVNTLREHGYEILERKASI